jgi:hypothetical protein
MPRISPEYLLADGSPRYGIRIGDGPYGAPAPEPTPETAAPEPARGGEAADAILQKALAFDTDQLAAAQNHRFEQTWAEQDDELVLAFRAEHADLAELAVRTTSEALKSNVKWFVRSAMPAAKVHGNVRRSRSLALRGSVNLVKFLFRTSRLLIVWLMVTGPTPEAIAGGLVLFFLLRMFARMNQARLKLPLSARLRWAGFRDLRRDITDAVLLALVVGDGRTVAPDAAAAVGWGWKHLVFVTGKVEEIRLGPR